MDASAVSVVIARAGIGPRIQIRRPSLISLMLPLHDPIPIRTAELMRADQFHHFTGSRIQISVQVMSLRPEVIGSRHLKYPALAKNRFLSTTADLVD
jgi:hypothetical protein